VLFNSYTFVLLFLPLTLIGCFAASRWLGRRGAVAFLVLASLCFYGWWNPEHVALLGASMAGNFVLGRELARTPRGAPRRRPWFVFGLVANLALIVYYKYAGFFAGTVNALAGTEWSFGDVVLPLAISFFTFQQIAYLVDSYRFQIHDEQHGFLEYCLFVTFFPQLIAGPIVHHAEVLPQFRDASTFRPRAEDLTVGASYFFVGLFKKVALADNVAVFARPTFDYALNGGEPTFAEAWIAALAYTLQLYLDFSGYSDMAIGAARMFGVRLPLNFDSPYKALDIADFWRRWHITLSRFLRDYLYIPLGGNRRGVTRRYVNLLATMLIGGLWHGAGWTFVAWGGLHGAYLVVHQMWRKFVERAELPALPARLSAVLSWSVTMLSVVVAWVFFRAESFDAAWRMLGAMSGANGFSLASAVGRTEPGLWILATGLLCIAAPNTAEFFARERPIVDGERLHGREPKRIWLVWRPTVAWAVAMVVIASLSILSLHRASEFLYFRF
jgi:D-alanyl-lipoteichoic acid acyltransferase DltB (MBOAT superfamily)